MASAMDILLRLRLSGQAATQAGLAKTAKQADRLAGAQKRTAQGAVAASKVGALAAGGLAVAALDAAGTYEKSLNVFQAVSSANAAEMVKVGKQAKKLGADVKLPGTSAADAAVAMTDR